jgi:sulfotransferase family protein
MAFRGLRTKRAAGPDLDSFEERVVWVASGPRSGSTWLLNLVGLHPAVTMLDEPLIGLHLGLWTSDVLETPLHDLPSESHVWHRYREDNQQYFFSPEFRSAWGPPLRTMMLARFAAHVERFGKADPKDEPILCIKEPMGCQASDLVLDVLPKARVLALSRDPRDVVASLLDAYREGSWFDNGFPGCNFAEVSRERRVRDFALRWRVRTEVALKAAASRDADQRLVLKYEDLRAEPTRWLTTVFGWMGVPDADVDGFVERLAFERGSSQQRGEGKFHRKAQPGSWNETLSPEEVRLIEQECAGPMAQLGYVPAQAPVSDLVAS